MSDRRHKMTHRLRDADYDYLKAVATYDEEDGNASLERLIRALRREGVGSFIKLSLDLPQMLKTIAKR